MIDIKELQQKIYNNKIQKGFNTTDIKMEFLMTYGELSEAYDALSKKQDNVGEELADVAIYLFSIANMLNIDLEKEINAKIEKNFKREYRNINGVKIKVNEPEIK